MIIQMIIQMMSRIMIRMNQMIHLKIQTIFNLRLKILTAHLGDN